MKVSKYGKFKGHSKIYQQVELQLVKSRLIEIMLMWSQLVKVFKKSELQVRGEVR